jgi:hypothetical protein
VAQPQLMPRPRRGKLTTATFTAPGIEAISLN